MIRSPEWRRRTWCIGRHLVAPRCAWQTVRRESWGWCWPRHRVLNTPGTIDADYRGEVMVLLVNLGGEPVEIRRGDRIAQLIVAPVAQAACREVEELPPTGRGTGGFGSTGR